MIPTWRRPGLWLGLGLAAAGAWVAGASHAYLLQVLGSTLLLGGGVLAWAMARSALATPLPALGGRLGSEWTWGRLLAEASGPLLLGLALIALYHPMLAGQMVWQGDHTVHEAKAFLLAERLLPSGHLAGWTQQSGTGYPAEVLYPPLGDLLVTALRYLTFRQLPFDATYAVTLFGVIAFGVLSFYSLGRRLFGPLAGLVAGALVLTDMGWFREGGYVFTLQYGVWPLHLGMVLSFLAVFSLHRLLRTTGWSGLARTALLTAAAILAHPVSLLFFLVAFPLVGLLAWIGSEPDDEPLLGRICAAASLGLALAAFWLLPFFARAPDFSAHVSNYWKPMADIGVGLVSAHLWHDTWAWPFVLAGVGALFALRERRPGGALLVALGAAFLLAGSLTWYAELHLPEWIASARYVQFQRFVVFVKLGSFLLAGLAVQRLLASVPVNAWDRVPGDAPTTQRPRQGRGALPSLLAGSDGQVIRRAAGWALALGLAAPFVLPVAWTLVQDRVLPVGKLTYAREKRGFTRDFRFVLSKVCAETRRPGAPFFRVGFLSGFNDHEMANALTYCPTLREVKLSFIPSETFRYRANLSPAAVPRSREDYHALNLRYVVTNATHPAPSWLRQVLRRGKVTLYEVPGYDPRPFTVVRRVAEPGQPPRFEPVRPDEVPVTLKRFSSREVVVQAGAVPPGHFLVLHVAHFANWHASRGGHDLPITAYDGLAPRVHGLMRVPLAQGTTRFRYRTGAVGWLSGAVSLLALVLLVLLGLGRRRPRWRRAWRERVSPLARRWRRAARRATLAIALGLGALGTARAGGCVGEAPKTLDLTLHLSDAQVSIRRPGGRVERCTTFRMGRWVCGAGRRFVGPVAEEWNLLNRLGLWAHPPKRGSLVIRYPRVRLGRRLEVRYGILQSGGTGEPAVLTVFVAGRQAAETRWPRRRGPAGWASRPLVVDTRAHAGTRAPLRFEVRTRNIGGRHFVLDPRVIY